MQEGCRGGRRKKEKWVRKRNGTWAGCKNIKPILGIVTVYRRNKRILNEFWWEQEGQSEHQMAEKSRRGKTAESESGASETRCVSDTERHREQNIRKKENNKQLCRRSAG